MVLRGAWQRSHPELEILGAGDLSALNQPEWYDGFAAILALTVFSRSTEKEASQRHLEQGHHKSTTILDACFHTDVDQSIHAHTPEEFEPKCIVLRLLFRTHFGEPHDCGRSFVVMKYS